MLYAGQCNNKINTNVNTGTMPCMADLVCVFELAERHMEVVLLTRTAGVADLERHLALV